MGRCPTCGSRKTLPRTLLVTGHAPTSLTRILCYGNASSPAPNRTNMASALKDTSFLQKLWAPRLVLIWSIEASHWTLRMAPLGGDATRIHHLWSRCFYPKNPSINFFLKICRISKNERPWITEQNGPGSSEASEQYKQWVFGVAAKRKNPPKQHPAIFPWNPNHLGVGAKRGKAKGAIADSASGG